MNYNNYWIEKTERREKNKYYPKRYDRIIKYITPAPTGKILDLGRGNGQLGKILDLGGGNGQFMSYISFYMYFIRDEKLLFRTEIWDISKDGIQIAREKGYTTRLIDIQKSILYKKKFGTIYINEVLEHLTKPNIALVNAYNLLEDKGKLIVCQPNAKADGKYHIRQYKYKEIKNDLIKSGFKIEKELVTPAFEKWQINRKDLFRKLSITLWLCFLLTFLPYSVRKLLANLYPSRFGLFYVFICKKV